MLSEEPVSSVTHATGGNAATVLVPAASASWSACAAQLVFVCLQLSAEAVAVLADEIRSQLATRRECERWSMVLRKLLGGRVARCSIDFEPGRAHSRLERVSPQQQGAEKQGASTAPQQQQRSRDSHTSGWRQLPRVVKSSLMIFRCVRDGGPL